MGIGAGKKVLVTGSRGFIGRNLVKRLLAEGYEPLEFDREEGDIETFDFSDFHPDHVVHLASRVYVPDSWTDTVAFYRTNTMGTINILELCRRERCTLTYISSYVYGFPQYLPVDENHPVQPANPYNHSKLMAEEMVSFYSRTFDIPTTVLRPVNIYGPGQHSEFLIPGIIHQVLDPSVETVEVMDLKPKRDYLFIDDFLEAILATLTQPGDFFNIGSGISYSVEDAIKAIIQAAGVFKPYTDKNITRKNEIWDVYVSIEKIGKALNWRPRVGFQEGIARCIFKH